MPSTQPRGRIGLPDQRTLLGWLFAFRIALATLLLVRASFVWSDRPENAFYVASGVLLFFVITGYGSWQILLKRIEPGPGFFITQALADLAVVSGLVRLGGEASTALAAMYVVVIAVYALLLPTWAGVTVALAAAAAYVTASLWANDNSLPPGLWGQIIVFGFVFLLVAVLGHRLQHSVVAQSRLETELKRVRFEAEEVLRSIKTGVITVDVQGRLAFVNPAGERLLGLPFPSPLGQPVMAHLQQVAPELHSAITAGLERGHRVARGEGTVHGSTATVPDRPLHHHFRPTFEGLPAVTAIFTDISELKQLAGAPSPRRAAGGGGGAVSASLAHEIRNPLASIRSSVEQLALSAQARRR